MRCTRKQQFLEAAERAEKNASVAKEPMVKETMLALAHLYRDLAKQMEELEAIRRKLRSSILAHPEASPSSPAMLTFPHARRTHPRCSIFPL